MIKLRKLEEPEILTINKEAWTAHYIALVASGQAVPNSLKNNYRHADIKHQIKRETFGKCAYCESKITHVCPGDIEHILPKSERPELIFNWDNLTLACETCNRTGKRTYYNPHLPLLNPYTDDLGCHLKAYGPMIFYNDNRGEVTRRVLKLNRMELIERRTERLNSLENLIDKWNREEDPVVKELLENELLEEARHDKEYSFIIQEHLRNMCGLVV